MRTNLNRSWSKQQHSREIEDRSDPAAYESTYLQVWRGEAEKAITIAGRAGGRRRMAESGSAFHEMPVKRRAEDVTDDAESPTAPNPTLSGSGAHARTWCTSSYRLLVNQVRALSSRKRSGALYCNRLLCDVIYLYSVGLGTISCSPDK